MITLGLIVVLGLAYYAGARCGVWLQLVHAAGFAVSFALAVALARPLGRHLTLWVPYPSIGPQSHLAFFTGARLLRLDTAFYRGVAFLLVLTLGWLATRGGAMWAHELAYREDSRRSRVLGGLLSVVSGYCFVFGVLLVLALIPVAGIQTALGHSLGASVILRHTPGLSTWLTAWWFG